MTSLVSLPFRVRGTVCKLLIACFRLRTRFEDEKERSEREEREQKKGASEFLKSG